MPIGRRHYQITFRDALRALDLALQFGGLDGVLNEGLIKSAIARPYNRYYRSIEKKTAALTQSVATNHGFTDGNKRTALILTILLLRKSGYTLRKAPDDESLEDAFENAILDTVNGQSFEDLVKWFKARIKKTPPRDTDSR